MTNLAYWDAKQMTTLSTYLCVKSSSIKAAFDSVKEQKEAAAVFMLWMATRTGFLEADPTSTPGTLGGAGGTNI